jgi:hypothetical protein
MINSDGQLYTIEGIAAALIMVLTAYLVVNSTSVYTAGDTHISDMQLEALGFDALKVMGTNQSQAERPPLTAMIEDTGPLTNCDAFGIMFSDLVNNKTTSGRDHIQYTASYSYRYLSNNSVRSVFLNNSRSLSGGEHAVRATKWVIVNKHLDGDILVPLPQTQNRAVLVEVLMWRD